MANKLIQPLLNPVWFYQMNPQELEQYRSRHIDLYPYRETLEAWQTKRPWAQPWQTSDAVVLQFHSDYGPLVFKIVDGWGMVHKTVNLTPKLQNELVPGMFLYELNAPLTGHRNGQFFYQLECGQGADGQPLEVWISDPQDIRDFQKETLLLAYKHHRFKGVYIFETGIAPNVRIKGRLSLDSPSAKDTLFEDDELSQRLTDSKPFEVYELQIGNTGTHGPSGIPDIHAKRYGRMLGCSEVLIDGRQYSKAEPALQPIGAEKGYPMKTWAIKLRDVENKDALTYENDEFNAGPDSYIMSVDAKGFGKSSEGQSQITDVQ